MLTAKAHIHTHVQFAKKPIILKAVQKHYRTNGHLIRQSQLPHGVLQARISISVQPAVQQRQLQQNLRTMMFIPPAKSAGVQRAGRNSLKQSHSDFIPPMT